VTRRAAKRPRGEARSRVAIRVTRSKSATFLDASASEFAQQLLRELSETFWAAFFLSRGRMSI
jgi:hypothetical protein